MEKKSKKTIIIGVTSLLLVTLILIGLTYAYYRTRIVGNDADTSISVTSKVLQLTYADGSTNEYMYLQNYTQKDQSYNWSTLSPIDYSTAIGMLNTYQVNSTSGFVSAMANGMGQARLRPAIVLKSGVEFANGDGTANNPYEIK